MTAVTALSLAQLRSELEAVGLSVQADEPLARHTIFRIGGPADLYVPVYTRDELTQALATAHRADAPVTVLGGGSNVLVSDRGIRGLVISNRMRDWEETDEGETMLLKVASGVALPGLALRTARQGWAGLHWAEGIPGTVGGGVIYNAGAFGGSLADCVVTVTAASSEGEERRFSVDEISYGYRSSAFQGELSGWIVLGAELRLQRGNSRELQDQLASIRTRRQATQPKEPSAGSIFRNPDPANAAVAAGRLVEEAGLKGTRRGDAVISSQHGNFFVNLGAATAANVAELIALAQEQVWARFGVRLQPEVRFIGEWKDPV
jgi:UDP-N-acetylmuramate dehydrogenase